MPWMALVGAGLSYYGSQQANNSANQNAANNLASQQNWQNLSDPFWASGAGREFQQTYTPQLQDMLAHPEQIQNNPLFQSEQKFGQQAVSRQQAASGNLNSGAEQAALSDYSSSHANQFYNQQVDRLSSLSGQNRAPHTSAATNPISPSTAYNMAAAPWGALSQGVGTLSSIYGIGGTPTNNNTAGNMSLPNSNGNGSSPFYQTQW